MIWSSLTAHLATTCKASYIPAMTKKNTSDGKTQRQRFIEAAKEVGASEDEKAFERALKQVAKAKPQPPKK